MKRKLIFSFLFLSICLFSLQAQTIEENMAKHNIVLPKAPTPIGSYLTYKITGNLVFINQVALSEGSIQTPGVIGKQVSEEDAKAATRQTMLNILAILKQAAGGDLENVKQAVQMTGIFNTEQGYTRHAQVMNAASNLLIDVFGDKGIHTRATYGASSIPLDSPVEIQAIFELK